MLMRRRSLDLAGALEAAREAERLVHGREYAVESQSVLELAAASGCSVYDCEFIALARDLAVPLLTSDAAVRKAFPRVVA